MPKETIHFAHANGFPAKTYSKIFALLEDRYEIHYLERHAHNPLYPVTDNWNRLVDELRDEIAERHRQPVIGIGHSLGGILHFLVACENPELYKSIILLDAPLVSRFSGAGIRILKATDLIEKMSPAKITRFRRSRWSSKDEAFDHFRQKEKFARFDRDVLRDYIEHGTLENQRGVELFFKPKIEADIYRTIPHNFAQFRKKMKVPIAYIGGTDSREAHLARLNFMRKNFQIKFTFIEGTHLFPFEKPLETSRAIRSALAELLQITRIGA